MLSFFPRGVLDEILNLIESVSEGFPSYSSSAGASYNFDYSRARTGGEGWSTAGWLRPPGGRPKAALLL